MWDELLDKLGFFNNLLLVFFFVMPYPYSMVDQSLIENLNLKARDFALQWKNMVRKAGHLKHYHLLDDDSLIEKNQSVYPLLARTLDRGLDRSLVGGFYVNVGKDRLRSGFPLSEVIYGINLSQKVVIEYLMTEFAPDNPMRMYETIGILNQVSEFFLMCCFYITKGFLEETYTRMNSRDKVSEELLKKYFNDDFFFKKD